MFLPKQPMKSQYTVIIVVTNVRHYRHRRLYRMELFQPAKKCISTLCVSQLTDTLNLLPQFHQYEPRLLNRSRRKVSITSLYPYVGICYCLCNSNSQLAWIIENSILLTGTCSNYLITPIMLRSLKLFLELSWLIHYSNCDSQSFKPINFSCSYNLLTP